MDYRNAPRKKIYQVFVKKQQIMFKKKTVQEIKKSKSNHFKKQENHLENSRCDVNSINLLPLKPAIQLPKKMVH